MPATPLQTTLLLRRRHARHPNPNPWPRLGIGLVAGLLIGLMLAFLVLALFYVNLTADLPPLGLVQAYFDPQYGAYYHPSRLLDRSAEHTLLTLENPGVPPDYRVLDPDEGGHLSPYFIQAAVGLLQPDFWQSPGFSWRGLTDPQPQTIAERLVNDLLLPDEPVGLRRTLRMRLLAAQLTAEFGRSQVLEWYLNEANFGHRAFGVGAASQLYLEQDAADVDLAGASLLLGILDAPALNPLDAPTVALERQQNVLLRLYQNGFVEESEYQVVKTHPLKIRTGWEEQEQVAKAFTRLVLEELSNRIGQERLERGGWIVTTTLDYDLQVQLVCTLQAQLNRLESADMNADVPGDCPAARLLPTLNLLDDPLGSDWNGSAALLDPQTGQLLALAGDTSLAGEMANLGNYPAGSLLTPLAAVGLFAGGYSPASLVWDIPTSLPEDLQDSHNPDATFHGPERLRNALVNDHLAGLAGLLEQNGADNIWRRVEPLGLSISAGSGAIYGAVELNPLQVAQVYAPLANSGVQAGLQNNESLEPALILAAKNGGTEAPGFGIVQTQALLSPPLAYLVQDILSDEPARRSSLGYPNPLELGRPVGAKLGQTAAGDDVWAAGFTPQRVLVVRLSRAAGSGQPRLDARLAAGVWHALMQTAVRDLPGLGWSQPEGISRVNVCDPSGLLPTVNCPEVVSEVFLTGNEPSALDHLYRKMQINRETNLLATVFTPVELVEERIFFIAPVEAQEWAAGQGLEQPPTAYDLVQVPASIPGVQLINPVMFAPVRGQVVVRGTADLQGMQNYTVQVGQGMNPTRWVEIGRGEKPVRAGTLATWQTPPEDGLYAIRLVVVAGDMSLQTTVIQVTVDNTPPGVRIQYPSADAQISLTENKKINLAAEVSDGLGIRQVEWLIDGRRIGLQENPPYNLEWIASRGEHQLVIRATDLAGNTTESEVIQFSVK